jgi:hypothetical protein
MLLPSAPLTGDCGRASAIRNKMVVNILLQSSNGFLMAARVLFVAFSERARISSPFLRGSDLSLCISAVF